MGAAGRARNGSADRPAGRATGRATGQAPVLGKTLSAELARRRRALMRTMGNDSIAIVPAAHPATRSRDSEYRYRQDSDFLYLTGFAEPEALAVLVPGRKAGQYLMFCRERDPEKETWHGRRVGVERAPQALGADDAFPIGDLDDILPGLLEGRRRVFHTLGRDAELDARLLGWLRRARSSRERTGANPDTVVSLDYHLHEMRLKKSRAELSTIRRAARITAAGHARAMRACRPGMREHELEAELAHEYVRHGAEHAFLPIVGGGANGCILHYTENAGTLDDGELVLIDSGAEYRGYAGDITRTFPVGGRFSEAQAELYSIVLEANLAAIEQVQPGNGWNAPHEAALRVLVRGLKELGLLKGTPAQLIRDEAYKPYYMHKTGHWLGLDVHDVGEYKVADEWRALEPGMVLTVEPGLYLGAKRGVPKRYRDVGIRVEDNVVVTSDGHEVLTGDVPKTIEGIESLMAER